ncbi:hypothetical protein GOBAR_DD29753 [Gossypium barbadense]|nr:hypothetical protein GOBAR_DD29753 [Gossypium barbadense]
MTPRVVLMNPSNIPLGSTPQRYPSTQHSRGHHLLTAMPNSNHHVSSKYDIVMLRWDLVIIKGMFTLEAHSHLKSICLSRILTKRVDSSWRREAQVLKEGVGGLDSIQRLRDPRQLTFSLLLLFTIPSYLPLRPP